MTTAVKRNDKPTTTPFKALDEAWLDGVFDRAADEMSANLAKHEQLFVGVIRNTDRPMDMDVSIRDIAFRSAGQVIRNVLCQVMDDAGPDAGNTPHAYNPDAISRTIDICMPSFHEAYSKRTQPMVQAHDASKFQDKASLKAFCLAYFQGAREVIAGLHELQARKIAAYESIHALVTDCLPEIITAMGMVAELNGKIEQSRVDAVNSQNWNSYHTVFFSLANVALSGRKDSMSQSLKSHIEREIRSLFNYRMDAVSEYIVQHPGVNFEDAGQSSSMANDDMAVFTRKITSKIHPDDCFESSLYI